MLLSNKRDYVNEKRDGTNEKIIKIVYNMTEIHLEQIVSQQSNSGTWDM